MNNEITIDGVVYVRKDSVTAVTVSSEKKDSVAVRQPSVQNWLTLFSHNGVGDLPPDMSKVEFYFSDEQKNGGYIEGNKLMEELKDSGKLILGAHVLDWLLEDVSRIPESWKVDEYGNTRYIYFFGTVYRNAVGNLCVRFLYWSDDAWYVYFDWLGLGWSRQCPVAFLASS